MVDTPASPDMSTGRIDDVVVDTPHSPHASANIDGTDGRPSPDTGLLIGDTHSHGGGDFSLVERMDDDTLRMSLGFLRFREILSVARANKRFQTVSSDAAMSVEHLDVPTDLRKDDNDSDDDSDDAASTYDVDDAWMAKYVANLKHISLFRHVGASVEKERVVCLLMVHCRLNIQSLVNIQITPEVAEKILQITSYNPFPHLSHVNVEVSGRRTGPRGNAEASGRRRGRRDHADVSGTRTRRRRRGNANDLDRPMSSFTQTFTDGVEVLSEFLAQCPSLTSLCVSEANRRPCGLMLPNLLRGSKNALRNLTSLSLQFGYDHYSHCNLADLTAGHGFTTSAVKNLRICVKATDAFSKDNNLLSQVATIFPSLNFMYVAYRYVYGMQQGWCGTGRRHRWVNGNAVTLRAADLPASLATLAIDRCFVSEENFEQLEHFKTLRTLVVVRPTDRLYAHANSYSDHERLPDENPEKFEEHLKKFKISLKVRAIDSATKWTSLVM